MIGILTYSESGIGDARKKLLRSKMQKRALLVASEIVMFWRNFVLSKLTEVTYPHQQLNVISIFHF